MSIDSSKQLWKGMAAGLVGGLVGSWVMMRFMEGPGLRIQHPASSVDGKTSPHPTTSPAFGDDDESVTMKAADDLVSAATGGRHLTFESKVQGGVTVHYAFGTVLGVVYGAATEYLELPTWGAGSVFGTVLWATTDLAAVPAVGYAPPPTQEPASAHTAHWLAHVIFGVSMELTRRAVRAAL